VLVCPDGTGGKIFLRVLLHLVMHDYPPLVSGALKYVGPLLPYLQYHIYTA
jgi:hypothetical protein